MISCWGLEGKATRKADAQEEKRSKNKSSITEFDRRKKGRKKESKESRPLLLLKGEVRKRDIPSKLSTHQKMGNRLGTRRISRISPGGWGLSSSQAEALSKGEGPEKEKRAIGIEKTRNAVILGQGSSNL